MFKPIPIDTGGIITGENTSISTNFLPLNSSNANAFAHGMDIAIVIIVVIREINILFFRVCITLSLFCVTYSHPLKPKLVGIMSGHI